MIGDNMGMFSKYRAKVICKIYTRDDLLVVEIEALLDTLKIYYASSWNKDEKLEVLNARCN